MSDRRWGRGRLARGCVLPYVRPAMRGSVILFVSLGLVACHRGSDDKPISNTAPEQSQVGSGSGSGGVRKQQVPPPFDLEDAAGRCDPDGVRPDLQEAEG